MIDLNKELLRCPHCQGMPIAFPVEELEKNDRIEKKVRCLDCGKEYWVTYKKSSLRELSLEEELALWRGNLCRLQT